MAFGKRWLIGYKVVEEGVHYGVTKAHEGPKPMTDSLVAVGLW